MNLQEFFRTISIEHLQVSPSIIHALRNQNITEMVKIYVAVQTFSVMGSCTIEGLNDHEMHILKVAFNELLVEAGVVKQKSAKASTPTGVTPSINPQPTHLYHTTRPPAGGKQVEGEDNLDAGQRPRQIANQSEKFNNPANTQFSPLLTWENQLAPQLRKVELIGEITVSKEELDEISLHFSRLFDQRPEWQTLNYIEQHCPATFLVFMVGIGVYGYKGGDFWDAYEQVLGQAIDHGEFGRLFEKLIKRAGKPQFHDLQERARRFVDPVLAHGGIPIYCLKDFFTNIVLNCVNKPQLMALDGRELVDEVLNHTTYTTGTDKPVLNFLEYGGRTATDLLDRSRNMLLAWQQNNTLLSSQEAGLPAHITQFFAKWANENSTETFSRGSRNRLKRPQLSLDPWGLGIFLYFPSQTVSALNMGELYWKVEAGDYSEDFKARTQGKGDQTLTRENKLRLNQLSENIFVKFSEGDNDFDWKITGYSPEHPILAFDPATGRLQNHISARETWLVYPKDLSFSILVGEGSLVEVLPQLPGEWSTFNVEAWDFSQSIRLGLVQNGEVTREVYVRSHEKIEQPSLEGGTIVPTNLEEQPVPVYAGKPPKLRIPLGNSEDIHSELIRWQVKIESIGTADPEVSIQVALNELDSANCQIVNTTAFVHLDTPSLLTSKAAGSYQISIKGPLGRDATLPFMILQECEVTGLQEVYIPDRTCGPKKVSFTIQTSLFAGVDSLNGADGIKVELYKPGVHIVHVPEEIGSVGLLVRRETISQQFIQVPISIRINRLRWRLVGDNELVESWLQKHSNSSLQDLLQVESPLLIVDLPGNNSGELSLFLNLIDIQGNLIQQLRPADRSSKRTSRFWRFDLSKIKHSMEMNDSPIFRMDLIGVRDDKGENEFALPAIVFSREIQLNNLQTEVISTANYHNVQVTWNEKKQLRSRALILWSLFRPWQAPIIENIPDAACGEYEFSIPRTLSAEGRYCMQMVVIDPWAPSPPPALPPPEGTPGVYEIELSSPGNRREQLDREIASATFQQTTQFSNRIELFLIRQYLGEIEASEHDLENCCRNLLPATSREILTLSTILRQNESHNLEKEFGVQIISPNVLARLFTDMTSGEISLTELTSLLSYMPSTNNLSAQSCEILVQLEDPKIRFKALDQLIAINISKAVEWVIKLYQQSRLSIDDAVFLLFKEKPTAIEQLQKCFGDSVAKQLLDLLRRYNAYSGLPLIRPGNWILTNAGWGRIEEILDPRTRISVDSFMEGDGKYILSVAFHIHESYDFTGEKGVINMVTEEISFPRANKIYVCEYCEGFISTKPDIYKGHLITTHGNATPCPGERTNKAKLTNIQFYLNPQQTDRDS